VDKKKDYLIYLIHQHDAINLHYDLRLEYDEVLLSWAVPKEPPLDVGVKRLAIRVKDHPLDYSNFQGDIPQGEYGAGKVVIWDKGVYRLVKFEPNEIIFNIEAEKLNGAYCLIKLKNDPKGRNWLFFKKKVQ